MTSPACRCGELSRVRALGLALTLGTITLPACLAGNGSSPEGPEDSGGRRPGVTVRPNRAPGIEPASQDAGASDPGSDPDAPPAPPLPPAFDGGFGSDTPGGLLGRVVRVTTLADDGPGSLRRAIAEEGPRTIVFEVGGVIRLESDLSFSKPFVTVAGQTAPSPGISLYHARVFIRTHDVVLQHLRIRPGDRHANGNRISSQLADNRDAVLIGTQARATHHIVLDHVSLSWSSDEMVSIWYNNSHHITFRDTLMAEPLSVSLHPKSADGVTSHGYCLLLGDDIKTVSVIRGLFAHCTRRSPRLGSGVESVVLDTVHYNPVETAINLQTGNPTGPARATVIGNVFKPGSNTKESTALILNKGFGGQARVYMRDNDLGGHPELRGDGPTILSEPEVWDESHQPLPPDRVFETVLSRVGARPWDRDSVDLRILEDVARGTGARIDLTADVGGYVDLPSTRHSLTPPADPQEDEDGDGVTNLVEWLASFESAVEARVETAP